MTDPSVPAYIAVVGIGTRDLADVVDAPSPTEAVELALALADERRRS